MNLGSIHHVAIITSDYHKTIDFYVNKLGFKIIRENFRKAKNDCKLDLEMDGCELEIFIKPDAPMRPSPEANGLRHLAFRVDDVEQVVRQLSEKGIECEPIRLDDYTHRKLTFFKDPDGLPLELHE